MFNAHRYPVLPVLPDWRLSIMPKELTNYARIMPDFINYAKIMPDFHRLSQVFVKYARYYARLRLFIRLC